MSKELTLLNVHETWKKECGSIDETELVKETSMIPIHFSRWQERHNHVKIILLRREKEFETLKLNKRLWYLGKLSEEELNALGWPPNPHKIIKSDARDWLDGDADILKAKEKLEHLRELLWTIDGYIDQLRQRQWQIKNMIEYLKFTNGVIV